MTVQERMKELIEAGATIDVNFSDGGTLSMLLGAAVWLRNPTRLLWCTIFPEDGRHGHETPYDTAKLHAGGRDIGFYQGDFMVLYVCPYEEGRRDVNACRDTFAAWRNHLREGDNAKIFEQFFETGD